MNKINASPQAMLIVRLAAAQAPLHWQLFAPDEPHHEASGRWPTDDASPFPALAEQYPAWVLIPASDCAFHSLTLPAGLRKPPLQVAPFLLEEQLADDVEATHFALLHRQQAQCEIVAVQRQKMRDWLARCESLSLQPLALTPDVLALPWQPPAWSAVQVDEQWLIRHQPWGGMAAENVWLTELLQSEAEEHVIDSYSPPPAAPGVWRLAGAACADIADPCRTPSGSAETQSAAGGVHRPAAVCAGELASGAVCRAGPGVTGRGKQRAGPSRSGASGRGGATGQPGLLSPLVSDGEKGD